jgi:two-component system, OmpR family, response regulator
MKHMPHILVVDDDSDITDLLCDYLRQFGFATYAASNGTTMRAQMAQHPIDLLVMDLQLPGEDGLSLTKQLRQQYTIPIVMLTARGNPIDRVIGLEMGADDYMSKPFEPRELAARIQTVLRRATRHDREDVASDVIAFDGWQLQRDSRRLISPEGLNIPLSNAEFQLLSTFLKTPRKLFTRDQLMAQACGRNKDNVARSIDLLVSRLRHKLTDDPRAPCMIKTVRGEGYVLNVQSVQGAPRRTTWAH